jgi:ABC-type phosphate transport system substrate-binding protein
MRTLSRRLLALVLIAGMAQFLSGCGGGGGGPNGGKKDDKKGMAIGLVQNAEGEYVEATLESVTAAAAGLSDNDISDDLRRLPLTNVKAKGAYPICGTTWMVFYVKQAPEKAEPLKNFARWTITDGQEMTKALHYARIPKSIVDRAAKKLDQVKGEKADGTKRLTGGGSSFVAPMMKKWAGVYPQHSNVDIDYTSSGSGNGISQMIDQKNDFGCTDAPMNDEQMKRAADKGGDVVHIPVVMGGVVPFYNLPEVDKPLKFTGTVLADIYLGKIKKWNEKPIQDLNPNVKLPETTITVVHRADASGTSYIWTEYLSKVSDEWKTKVGQTTEPKWPTGAGAVKNDGVAGLVSGTPGAIGYVELIYALSKK